MDYNYEMSVFLTKTSTAIIALSNMANCNLSAVAAQKVAKTMLDQEQTVLDFALEMNVSAASLKVAITSIIHANETMVAYLQKNQYRGGDDFDELRTALILENENLSTILRSA